MSKVCLVPAADIQAYCRACLKKAEAEFAEQKREAELHKKEKREKAIPALKRRYQEEVTKWEALPEKKRKRTQKPHLESDRELLILYGERTLVSWWRRFNSQHWPPKEQWYARAWIYLKDVHRFRHKRAGVDSKLSSVIWKLKMEVQKYEGDFWVELPKEEVVRRGLTPSNYRRILRYK